jgi:hypothetical protein
MRRRLIRVVATVILTLLAAMPVAAHDETGESEEPRRGRSPAIELPNDGDAFIGPTSSAHHGEDSGCPPGQICPQHYSGYYHYHYVTGHTRKWDGYIDHRTGLACKGPCTISRTVWAQWSNKWGASIGFDTAPVSGSVGYDVTYSSGYSTTFSFRVPSGATREIWYRDWYHITDLSLRTDYLNSYPPYAVFKREYGTGWAGDWYLRVYSARNV